MTRPELHRDALDALGDANRRAIVEILSHGGQSVQQIADQLPISRPADFTMVSPAAVLAS